MAGYSFTERGARRIVDNVRWGEKQRQNSSSTYMATYKPQSEQIYVKLVEKDEDKQGYWKAEEVVLDGGAWELKDGGRKWDGDEYPYIRHVRWEDAVQNAIVEVFQIPDVSDEEKPYIWVFKGEITNPEAFVFYADKMGGIAQSVADDVWKMPRGGHVYTNYGDMEVDGGFELPSDKTAYCLITFINYIGEWHIGAAEMTIEDGDYWKDKGSELEVRVKIATATNKGDVCRLEQHHAGDIRFELFQDCSVTSGNAWIGVVNNNSNYVVSHLLPGATKHQDEFLAFTGNCDDMPTDSFESFIAWLVNARVHLRYDELGHIYQRENCYGEIEDYTYDEEDDDGNELSLSGNLTAVTTSSNPIQPEAVNGDDIDASYTVLNGGLNFADYVGTEDIMFIVQNSKGNLIPISDKVAGPYEVNFVAKADNVNGTSGKAPAALNLSGKHFRFNDTITVKAGVVNKGLGDTVVLTTATLGTTITFPDDIRDYEDPNSENYNMTLTSTSAFFVDTATSGYRYEIDFVYSDGTPVLWALDFDNNFSSGPTLFDIEAGNATGTFAVQFDLRDGTSHGDVIKMKTKMFWTDGATKTDANVHQDKYIYVGAEGECYTDEDGADLTDENDDCYGLPSGFENAQLLAKTDDLNNWVALEPILDVEEFSGDDLPNRCSFGYNAGGPPGWKTEGFICYSRFGANTTSITLNYRWNYYSDADPATFRIVASNTNPETGLDVLSMTDTGITITPTDDNYTLPRTLDISSAIGSVDSSQTFFLCFVPKQYYDGEDPSTWPDAVGDGGEVWIEIDSYTIS